MSFDPAPFWADVFLYLFESKYMKQLILNGSSKVYKYHGVSIFIDNLFVTNDGNDFLKNMYHKELELRVEHQGDHASFLDLDIRKKAFYHYSTVFRTFGETNEEKNIMKNT